MISLRSITKHLPLGLVLLFGVTLSSLPVFFSGRYYPQWGISFWGPNGHDAIWHLSLITQIDQHLPPSHPVFSGHLLTNYHWGYDLFVSLITRVLPFLDLTDIYFRFIPVVFALLLGILSYKFTLILSKNRLTAVYFAFLNYFAGSFGWVVTLIQSRQLSGESLFWAMQPISTQLNPPFAFSLLLLLLILILWLRLFSSKSISWPKLFCLSLLVGSLAAIKVYAAILILGSFWLFFFWRSLTTRQISKDYLYFNVLSTFWSILFLYLLGSLGGSSLLVFQPFWFSHSLIESTDKLYLPQLASLRFNLAANPFTYKLPVLIAIEVFLVIIFFVGNLGTRIIGIFHFFSPKFGFKTSPLDQLLFIFFLISALIPILFVQKGTPWNTIQFLYYFLFVANYYFAQTLTRLTSFSFPLAVFILLSTIPTNFDTLKGYLGNPPPASLPTNEIKALEFLRHQPQKIVLTYPYDPYPKQKMKTPIPLAFYETTAYVAAFSHHPLYLGDEMNLDITGYNWRPRRQQSLEFFNSKNIFTARGFLLNNNIDYLYLLESQNLPFSPSDLQIKLIYDQDSVRIFQVLR
jgi:hypothetical protein